MDAKAKADILHGVVRKFGGGGGDITSEEWGRFVAAQNDGYRTGPEIGERVPDFSLPDQHGKPRTLKDLSGPTACCWSSAAAPIGDRTAATSSSSCNSHWSC